MCHHELGSVCSPSCLLFTVKVQFLKHVTSSDKRSQAASQSDSIGPCSAWLQEAFVAALVEVHVRLVLCSLWGWVACALSCSLVCSFLLSLLLAVDGTVLLCRSFLLGDLHLRFGLGYNRVTSREQLLYTENRVLIMGLDSHIWTQGHNVTQRLTLVFALMSLTLIVGSTARLCLLCWFMVLFIQIIASLFSLSTLVTSASSKWSYCSSWKWNKRMKKIIITVRWQ